MSLFPDSKTLLEIGPIRIHYYALCILIGATIAYLLGQYYFKKKNYAKEILSDYFFGVLFTGIIGARIWYVIFMWKEIYNIHPEQIIEIWNGGLAIQGGIIAALIYSYYYFKSKDIPFLYAGDAIMPGVLIAQALGRWGNYFNQEAYGSEVSLDFLKSLHLPQNIIDHMYISGAYHHPTFLYESVGNIIVFLIILFMIRKLLPYRGTAFFSYFIGYGIVRFFVEGLRTDSLMLGSLRMAQVMSLVFILVGLIGFIYSCIKKIDSEI